MPHPADGGDPRRHHDTLIRGGWLIDGSGAARRRSDVAIEGDRISHLGDLASATASLEIDARGKIVAPGFIDAHTHDDSALLRTPEMTAKVSQGVTTVVVGNCGASLAPLRVSGWPPLPLDLLGGEENFRFDSFAAYVEALDRTPPATNAVFLVGHTTLRRRCMEGALDRTARDSEIAAMQAEVAAAMQAGATGLSTGLDYATAVAASTEEVVALAEIAAGGGGLYVTHTRDYFDKVAESVEEALEIGRRARLPVIFSHHQASGPKNHGKVGATLARIASAMERQEVSLDAYPYAATSTVIKPERCGPEIRVVITWSNPHPEMVGRELSDIAALWGCDRRGAAERLCPGGAVYFQLDEADVREVLAFPHTMIGSDGLPSDRMPHPRLWGSFPRVLGHYARDVGLFPLEEAVRRMTGLPAGRFGLADRGVIREGAFADVTVFDAETIIDKASFAQPVQAAAGIEHVLVNGERIWSGGRSTGRRPGRALRRMRPRS
jgi:N-acyl-D-amino-acid deacylase